MTDKSTFLIFDTETNGLPTQRVSDFNHIKIGKQPELLELGYQTHRADGSFIERKEFLVKPTGFQITEESRAIHGISQEYAERHGKPLRDVLLNFKKDFEATDYAIGQGVTFDAIVLGASYLKTGIPIDWGFPEGTTEKRVSLSPKFLTTKHTIVRKWWRARTKKNLALKYIYHYFSNKQLEGAHSASVDAAATAYVFFKLLKEIPSLVEYYRLSHIDIENLVPYTTNDVEKTIRENRNPKNSEVRGR